MPQPAAMPLIGKCFGSRYRPAIRRRTNNRLPQFPGQIKTKLWQRPGFLRLPAPLRIAANLARLQNLGLPGGVNGSTRDFGSLCPGSNPGRAALSRFVPPATMRSCLHFSFIPWFCRSPDGSNFCSPDLHGSRTVTGSRESHAVSPSLHLPCSTPATRSVLRPSSLPATCPCSPTKSRLENLRIDIVNPRPNSHSSRSDTV
jgi:hypothetical protein